MTEQLQASASSGYRAEEFAMNGAAREGVRFVRNGSTKYRVEYRSRSRVTRVQVWTDDGWSELWNKRLLLTKEASDVARFVETQLLKSAPCL